MDIWRCTLETLNNSHLLVIGGTGFIGHHLLKAALIDGFQITSVSLNKPNAARFIDGVRYLHFDITDKSQIEKYIDEKYEYVVNLGGYINHLLFKDGGRHVIEAHFNAIQNLLEIIPNGDLKRFVQIGSSDEYGDAKTPQYEELREKPISPYSLAKVASTHLLQMLHQTENLPSVILRLFLTYGPGQNSDRFLPQIIRGCLDDTEFPTSSAEQLRDFCFVEDTVQAILHALVVPEAVGEVINVSSGEPVSIRTMIDKVCNYTGTGKPQYAKIPYRAGENMALYANVEKAEKLLRWKAVTSLDEGLQKTIDWFVYYSGPHK
jgi:nucleoside-diphosphate-sugar epimerase